MSSEKFSSLEFVKHRKRFFLLSLIVIAAGLISFSLFGMNTGVDFSAGTTLDLTIDNESTNKEEATALIAEVSDYDPVVTIGGDESNRVSTRFSVELTEEERNEIINVFESNFGEGSIDFQENTVNPAIAKELVNKAVIGVLLASVGIVIYVSIRFEWRFALAAIISLLHNALIVIGMFSIFRLQVDVPFIAAVLTVIGYSINDTIIIFDRIRENLKFAKIRKKEDLEATVNLSIRQTLTRTINTSATTVLITVMLLIFGSEAIRLFSLALVIGLIAGVYSSIFIASQIWLTIKIRDLEKEQQAAVNA